jgi:hypothetical protein
MTDKLVVAIGNWVTLEAEGLFALGAAIVIALYFGALWLAAQQLSSRQDR